jgi:hypothetical protein
MLQWKSKIVDEAVAMKEMIRNQDLRTALLLGMKQDKDKLYERHWAKASNETESRSHLQHATRPGQKLIKNAPNEADMNAHGTVHAGTI